MDFYIEPLVKRALEVKKLGISEGTLDLISTTPSCENAKADRVILKIPYAGHTLQWNILFDSRYPEIGPDFMFGEDTFLMDPDTDDLGTNVPSLAAWDPTNKDALLDVLMELFLYYKRHQISLLWEQQRLELEYSMLIKNTETSDEDVEVILLPLGNKPHLARFLIRMNVDLSDLPLYIPHRAQDVAILEVNFTGPGWNNIVPQLYLSKSLQDVLGGGPMTLQLPLFTPDKCMMDYLPEVHKLIRHKINQLLESHEKKKEFIASLVLLQPGNIVEYDAVEFSEITILLELRDFHFFIHFNLPLGFPQEEPIIHIQSIYHIISGGKVYSEKIDHFHWSPRLDFVSSITKILDFIVQEVVHKFQSNSVKLNRYESSRS